MEVTVPGRRSVVRVRRHGSRILRDTLRNERHVTRRYVQIAGVALIKDIIPEINCSSFDHMTCVMQGFRKDCGLFSLF